MGNEVDVTLRGTDKASAEIERGLKSTLKATERFVQDKEKVIRDGAAREEYIVNASYEKQAAAILAARQKVEKTLERERAKPNLGAVVPMPAVGTDETWEYRTRAEKQIEVQKKGKEALGAMDREAEALAQKRAAESAVIAQKAERAKQEGIGATEAMALEAEQRVQNEKQRNQADYWLAVYRGQERAEHEAQAAQERMKTKQGLYGLIGGFVGVEAAAIAIRSVALIADISRRDAATARGDIEAMLQGELKVQQGIDSLLVSVPILGPAIKTALDAFFDRDWVEAAIRGVKEIAAEIHKMRSEAREWGREATIGATEAEHGALSVQQQAEITKRREDRQAILKEHRQALGKMENAKDIKEVDDWIAGLTHGMIMHAGGATYAHVAGTAMPTRKEAEDVLRKEEPERWAAYQNAQREMKREQDVYYKLQEEDNRERAAEDAKLADQNKRIAAERAREGARAAFEATHHGEDIQTKQARERLEFVQKQEKEREAFRPVKAETAKQEWEDFEKEQQNEKMALKARQDRERDDYVADLKTRAAAAEAVGVSIEARKQRAQDEENARYEREKKKINSEDFEAAALAEIEHTNKLAAAQKDYDDERERARREAVKREYAADREATGSLQSELAARLDSIHEYYEQQAKEGRLSAEQIATAEKFESDKARERFQIQTAEKAAGLEERALRMTGQNIVAEKLAERMQYEKEKREFKGNAGALSLIEAEHEARMRGLDIAETHPRDNFARAEGSHYLKYAFERMGAGDSRQLRAAEQANAHLREILEAIKSGKILLVESDIAGSGHK